MTGREKILAALSSEGSAETPAVFAYPSLFLRDHWADVTDQPWWAPWHPAPAVTAQPQIDLSLRTGIDWFRIERGADQDDQRDVSIEETPDGVYRVNKSTGERRKLIKPEVSGQQSYAGVKDHHPALGVTDLDELDAIMARYAPLDWPDDGAFDPARLQVEALGGERMPMFQLSGGLWPCHALWGFEAMMEGIYAFPELLQRAMRRFNESRINMLKAFARVSPALVWIEDCMTDMISPEALRKLNQPVLRELTEAIREAGCYSIHYFCGDPTGKWDLLLDTGADALSLEESKKGFAIDIDDVVDRVGGRMAILGNLDTWSVLERGSDDDVRAEVERQCAAGRRNRNRFIMSTGSPVTPGTPLERVRLFCDMAHGLA